MKRVLIATVAVVSCAFPNTAWRMLKLISASSCLFILVPLPGNLGKDHVSQKYVRIGVCHWFFFPILLHTQNVSRQGMTLQADPARLFIHSCPETSAVPQDLLRVWKDLQDIATHSKRTGERRRRSRDKATARLLPGSAPLCCSPRGKKQSLKINTEKKPNLFFPKDTSHSTVLLSNTCLRGYSICLIEENSRATTQRSLWNTVVDFTTSHAWKVQDIRPNLRC